MVRRNFKPPEFVADAIFAFLKIDDVFNNYWGLLY